MKRNSLPPIILGVFLLSLLYWIYLALNTRMVIVFDSVDYRDFGRMIQQHGFFPAYFENGPRNEPLYPLLMALSMQLEGVSGVAYTKIMASIGVLVLMLTQIMIYAVVRQLNIRTGICAAVLAYFAISPALNNSAFSLYSEIATYPFILGIVIASGGAWQAIKQNNIKTALGYGGLLGILFTATTLVKAVFECICPAYLIIFFGTALYALRQNKQKVLPCIICILAALALFYIPITGYKWLNLHYNGNFAITYRGSWALYGNTARRMQPLTVKRFLTALAYAPGQGVCESLFGEKECSFWSFSKSDEFGMAKASETSAALIALSEEKALSNPPQYALLMTIEGLKMFFWESTQIGFVEYPPWLTRIYNTQVFKNALRLVVAMITLPAVLWLWLRLRRPDVSPLLLSIGLLTILTIFFYSFFFILTRYALPIAPLYWISIAVLISDNRRSFKPPCPTPG